MEKTKEPQPRCPPPPGLPHPPKPTYLELPDLLAFLGDLPHRLPHEGDQHVEQEDESEDDVGDQEDDKDPGVLGVLDHLQVPHADGQLEEVQQEGAEGLAVAAGGVGGRRAVGAVPAAGLGTGAGVQQGDQRCRRGQAFSKVPQHAPSCHSWRQKPAWQGWCRALQGEGLTGCVADHEKDVNQEEAEKVFEQDLQREKGRWG